MWSEFHCLSADCCGETNTEAAHRITSQPFWAPEKGRDTNVKQPPHFIAWVPKVETSPKAQQAESN
jgi:hypothetical protein